MSLIQFNIIRNLLSYSLNNYALPAAYQATQKRLRSTKHWDPKFKKLRALKFIKVKLPDFETERQQKTLTPDEIKSRMKERGMVPPRSWMEKPIYISCTGGIFEPYVPPEGDGKMSAISVGGAKQNLELLSKKSKSMLAVRKIRQFDEDFDPRNFAQEAQEIYIKSHKALAEKNHDVLHECATERAFPLMVDDVQYNTIHWQFLKSLEPPRVVHVRCTDVVSKENIYAQVTVRFHTQQTLAVYDRFGRLVHGSEVVAKDVLEYVVFEKHIANQYGIWRVHDKIIPDWMPAPEPGIRSFVKVVAENETGIATVSPTTTSLSV